MGRQFVRRPRAAVGAALALAASGCWGQVGGNAANQSTNDAETVLTPQTVDELAPLWTARGVATIAWSNQIIGIDDGDVFSISATDGATQWVVPNDVSLPGGLRVPLPTNAGPAVVDDEIWASLDAHILTPGGGMCGGLELRLDLATGERRTSALPLVTGDIVSHGALVATYQENYLFSQTSGCTLASRSPVTVRSAATGEQVWSGAPGGRPVMIDDQLVNASGTTLRSYVASGCGAPTCEPVWSQELPLPVAEVAAGGGHVFVMSPASGSTRTLFAVDRTSGAVAWSATVGATGGRMSVAGGRVHVVADGTLATFDAAGCGAATCAPLWQAALPASAAGRVITGGGVVYQATTDGTVSAFDAAGCGAATCPAIASVSVAGTPRDAILDRGRLYVTSTVNNLGTVTAFGLT